MKKYFMLFLLAAVAAVCPAAAQDLLQVSGTVTSAEDGEPLIGATVRVLEEKAKVAVTDLDGNYRISVKPGQTLGFSYVGYQEQKRKVTKAGSIDIGLTTANDLDELVVIGYGTMKKSDLTGSVSTIEGKNLQKTPSASLANALQGQAAGVTVNALSGEPGKAAEVRIRGIGSINGANPIYVVDGVICDDINFVSPNDIESTEILKDASATAIYGSRGANGVIIVTTRGGKKNQRARISFDGYVGMMQRWRKLDVMGAHDMMDAYVAINGNTRQKKDYAENGMNAYISKYLTGNSPYFPTVYNPETNPSGFDYASQNTDWQDEVFRNALIQNYHLSIDGGGENFTYSMSAGWFGQEGTVIGSDYSRFTGRLNTTYQATPWLKIGENVSVMASVAKNSNGGNSGSAGANLLAAAFAMAPWDPTHYSEGSVNPAGKDLSGGISAGSNFKNVTNPFSYVAYRHPHDRAERWVGNVFAELTPYKGFNFKSTFSFDYNIGTARSFSDKYEVSSYDKMEKNFLSSSISRAFYWNVDNILTYSNTFGKNFITAMVGQTVEQYTYYSIGDSGASILNPVERNWYLSQTTEDNTNPAGDSVARNRRFSWLGRIHYSFDDRYLATVNFRADGSSRFPENAWGFFPSFALAWRISSEQFMDRFDNLSNLKLRFGWGKVGNDAVANSAFSQNVETSSTWFTGYPFGNPSALAYGSAVTNWVNRNGHWENTEQWTLGVDFGFFQNRLNGSVDFFIRDTQDMLMSVVAPAHAGNQFSAQANVGEVRNKGVEIQLEHRNTVGDFSYSISGNVSFIKNKLTALNGGAPVPNGLLQMTDQGFPLYYFRGYEYEGVYRTQEEIDAYLHGYPAGAIPYNVGDAKYKDQNGDGMITDEDRVNIGDPTPWLNYGLNLTGAWKGFDLSLFFQGVGGNKIYNYQRQQFESNGTTSVLAPVMKDAWTVDNPDGSIPNPKNSMNYLPSDRFLENGSYFRLKNIQLGYTLPQSVLDKLKLSNWRFYIQCGNVFTITRYKGFDPEVDGGVDYGNYPQARSFIFGMNITY